MNSKGKGNNSNNKSNGISNLSTKDISKNQSFKYKTKLRNSVEI